jgi:hypothetical protein
LSNSTRSASADAFSEVSPVALPPGRDMLATMPLATGSPATTNAYVVARMRSTWCCTISRAA